MTDPNIVLWQILNQKKLNFESKTHKSNLAKRYVLFNYKFNNGFCSEKNLNIGDYIQTLAVQQALSILYKDITKRDFVYCDRENLFRTDFNGEFNNIAIMQGWFGHTYNFLPNATVRPVWVGTHFTPPIREFINEINFNFPNLLNSEFGCRDTNTLNFLSKIGLKAYLSRCLTLTFSKRKSEISDTCDTTYFVNVNKSLESFIPDRLAKNAVRINQRAKKSTGNWQSDLEDAANLLNVYRNNAKLVVTSALHCASPCLAMGIPVILITTPANKYRIDALRGLLKFYTEEDLKNKKVDWVTEAPNIEPLKTLILKNLDYSIFHVNGEDKMSHIEIQELRNEIKNFACVK